jgi:hypothetical protein
MIYLTGNPWEWSKQSEEAERQMARASDQNQKFIVADLRRIGASVQDIHTVGKGCPDIIIGYKGRSWLAEVKMHGAGLTDDEKKWHAEWRGQVSIVTSSEEAIALVTGGEA